MKIYTDGATSNNGYEGAIGGWAFAIISETNLCPIYEDSGRIEGATNNICELTAIIKACQATLHLDYINDMRGHHTIYSDSAYCINCYKQRWYKKWEKNGCINSQKTPVANQDLRELLIPFFEDPRFEFEYVKGHDPNKWNNYVDRKAVEARGG